jgi:dihydroneopterin aldolase
MEKKKETKETLRKFKEKDSDESRIEYWESRKVYERTVENKRCIWQEKAAEYVIKLVRQKRS